jgi:LPS O-antigen subunit length determinant protein (WzzB/FepE family)
LSYYLEELDNKMRSDIIREANSRKAYLDAQMKSTADPWVMQKLQAMVGMEMEKSMVVADRSFDVLESPMVPLKKSKPKRATIGIIFLFLGFCLSGGAVLGMDYYNKAKGKYKEVWGE